MICPKCKANLYEGAKVCLTCGYSEARVKMEIEREVQDVTISRFPIVNEYYRKIFGHTHKSIIKKILKFSLGIFLIIFLFFHFFIYLDISNGCFVTLRPALVEFSNTSVKKGIKYLKKNFPAQYNDFCTNVKTISPNIGCGGFGGGCFYGDEPGIIYISTTYGNYTNAAKVIIHETCHAIQYNEGRGLDEVECHSKDEVIPWNLMGK